MQYVFVLHNKPIQLIADLKKLKMLSKSLVTLTCLYVHKVLPTLF